MGKGIRFKIGAVFPPACEVRIDPSVSVLSELEQLRLLERLARYLRSLHSFSFTESFADLDLMFSFAMAGQTAGVATLAIGGRIAAVGAFMPRIDPADDKRAILAASAIEELRDCQTAAFDEMLNASAPLAATMFPDEVCLNNPILHSTMATIAAAFFDQYGVGSFQYD